MNLNPLRFPPLALCPLQETHFSMPVDIIIQTRGLQEPKDYALKILSSESTSLNASQSVCSVHQDFTPLTILFSAPTITTSMSMTAPLRVLSQYLDPMTRAEVGRDLNRPPVAISEPCTRESYGGKKSEPLSPTAT